MKSVLLPSKSDSKIKLLKKLAEELDMKVMPIGKTKSKSANEIMLARKKDWERHGTRPKMRDGINCIQRKNDVPST